MPYVITEECTGCFVCLDFCPEDAIIPGEIFTINREKCTECGECVEHCPLGIIHYVDSDNIKNNKNDKS